MKSEAAMYNDFMPRSPSAINVLGKLRKVYSPPKSFLSYGTPLDLLVATVLSARCTDKVVNKVTKSLFEKYKTAEDYANADIKVLESDIRSCGTFRNKARAIRETCRMIVRLHEGKVPDSMEELLRLPGVGRKTAAIVLSVAFGKNEGIAVDTHVARLARRLGITDKKTQDAIEGDLMEKIPKKHWGEVNALFISHGRSVCTSRNRKCKHCPLNDQCPSSLC